MFVWVILHYMSYKSTLQEVNHILNDITGDKRIIIVDNASPNGSGQKLDEYFATNRRVNVILNQSNVGFARGNDIGYIEALKLKPDFIVLANNDIEFSQKNFIQLVQASFEKQRFDVMGPDVFVPETGIHQNPKRNKAYSNQEVVQIHQRSVRLINQPTLIFKLRANLKRIKILRRFVLQHRQGKVVQSDSVQTNVILHGSLLIFSKDFFIKVASPFDEGTFFYFETEILDKHIRAQGMVSKYDPTIKVLHHQNTATKSSFQSAAKQQKFQLTNMAKSTQRFLDLFGQEN
ncbi:glycosyltransferase [Oenococcus sicerae]|uniref:Glycosyltransferase n=1 Tax=Oenococcus sicerae TaxID=2203724 RepID=A0ABX5QKN9_9LACO|nr:glycosyltransferase [Oenococcus sicerae]QAS69335.1 glycosyltransferase [Oenococcus sicerae]